MKAPIAAFLLVLAASSAFAQTVAPELAPAAAKYKADMATLDAQRLAALAQAQKSHAAALDAAEKTATAAGNLPVVAAITKERESLIADTLTPNFPDGLPKNLLATRKAYLDAAAHIRANEATRRSAIGAEYLRALASLQSKAAANPELAQQIAAEKGKLLATTIPNGTKPPGPTKSVSAGKATSLATSLLGSVWVSAKADKWLKGFTIIDEQKLSMEQTDGTSGTYEYTVEGKDTIKFKFSSGTVNTLQFDKQMKKMTYLQKKIEFVRK